VVHACNSSYSGGRVRKIMVEASQGKSERPYLKNKLKSKRNGVLRWLK
jgi:hypothetical protein